MEARPGPKSLNHRLYHLANAKKLSTFYTVGLGSLARPLKAWSAVTCSGEDCYFETEAEKLIRERKNQ
jgi:hypothetical protein